MISLWSRDLARVLHCIDPDLVFDQSPAVNSGLSLGDAISLGEQVLDDRLGALVNFIGLAICPRELLVGEDVPGCRRVVSKVYLDFFQLISKKVQLISKKVQLISSLVLQKHLRGLAKADFSRRFPH